MFLDEVVGGLEFAGKGYVLLVGDKVAVCVSKARLVTGYVGVIFVTLVTVDVVDLLQVGDIAVGVEVVGVFVGEEETCEDEYFTLGKDNDKVGAAVCGIVVYYFYGFFVKFYFSLFLD